MEKNMDFCRGGMVQYRNREKKNRGNSNHMKLIGNGAEKWKEEQFVVISFHNVVHWGFR